MKIGTAPIKALPVLAVASLCTAAAADCNSSLLYDNGFPNGCNGIRSELDPGVTANRAADDWNAVGGENVDDIHVYTLDGADFAWTGNVIVAQYADTAGDCLPDFPPVAELAVPGAGGMVARTLVQTPGPFGFDRYRYDVEGIGFTAVAGTNFFSMQSESNDGVAAISGGSFTETTRCVANGDVIVGCEMAFDATDAGVFVPGSTVFGDMYDLAFQLTTCLPEGDLCQCDFDADGDVDVDDLLILLGAFGVNADGDCDGDGDTDVDDLLALLAEWGSICGGGGVVNDECENAILIFEGDLDFDTTDATVNPDDPAWTCAGGGGPDIWYCFKAECTADITVSTCGQADYDTAISVYTTAGPGCDGDLLLVGCNDDGGGDCGLQSLLVFPGVEGEHYKIRVGGFNGATGTGTLSVVCGSGEPNVTCDTAVAMNIGDTVSGDTSGAPVPVLLPGDCDGVVPTNGGLWYTVVGDGTTLTATTCNAGTNYDTILTVLCGGCNQQFCVGSNDEDPVCFVNFVGESTFSWCSAPGEEYIILVHGNAEGNFELSVTSDGVACTDPPICTFICDNVSGIVNDCCEDRIVINDGDTAYDTTGANTDGQAHATCQFDGQTYHDIWYNYTATCDGILTVSTCNQANYDSDLVVYDGCGPCYDFALLGCNDDGAGCAGFSSLVQVPVTAGNCYKIRVGGWQEGDQGTGTVTLSCDAACAWECPAGSIPECGPQECPVDGDDANNDGNGGCNNAVPAFCNIAVGDTVCGEISTFIDVSGGQFRDTDWYRFTVPAGGEQITVTCNAETTALFGIVDIQGGACTAPAFIVSATTLGNCDEQSVSAFLGAGDWVAFASFSAFTGLPCGSGINDYWLRVDGGGGPCVFECPAGSSVEQGPQVCPVDGDDANNDGNGGCNNAVPSYGAIACGETICGQVSTYVDITGGAFRDTDWYQINHPGGDLTVTCNGEPTMLFGVVDHQGGACTGPVFVVSGTTGGNCDEQSVTATGLAAGTYVVFASPTVFAGVDCANGDYWVRADCP